MVKSSSESPAYAALGASSAKSGVLKAVGEGATSRYFASPIPDPFGDATRSFFLHADGAGTKSIVAYLIFRETGDASVFASLATDSLVMNLDDIACSGGLSGLVLSNTIGRNRSCIPDSAIEAVIKGYQECVSMLRKSGIEIQMSGGETADVGDLVRTIIVDSTLCARIPQAELVDAYRVKPGDLIIGFSSTGQSRHESRPNSGIGSNGLTLARNVLLSRHYAEAYPEVCDPNIRPELAYRGPYRVTDQFPGLGMTVGDALLSPTRSYAPLLRSLLASHWADVHSLVHCTGGGQTKIKRFGKGVRFEKSSLFPVPPLFLEIQRCGKIPWDEMYAVFNMGHRLEACVEASASESVVALAHEFGIAAQVIGRVTSSSVENEVVLETAHGTFVY